MPAPSAQPSGPRSFSPPSLLLRDAWFLRSCLSGRAGHGRVCGGEDGWTRATKCPAARLTPVHAGVLRRQASEWLAPRARRNFSSLNGVFTRPRIPARVVTPCAKAGLALCGAGHEHPAVTRRPLRVAGVESKPENFAAGRNT